MIRQTLLTLSLFASAAANAAAAPIQASGAWSRPAADGLATAVAYLTLTNRGAAPDRLVSEASPEAARVALHRSVLSGGVMDMRPVAGGLELPPGRPVMLAPNGYHLMLEGLRGGLAAGARYPLTLRFAHAAPMTVMVEVRMGPDPMAGMKMAPPR